MYDDEILKCTIDIPHERVYVECPTRQGRIDVRTMWVKAKHEKGGTECVPAEYNFVGDEDAGFSQLKTSLCDFILKIKLPHKWGISAESFAKYKPFIRKMPTRRQGDIIGA